MQSPEASAAQESGLSGDVIAELTRLGRSAATVEAFYREGLELIVEHFGAALGIVRLELPAKVVDKVTCSNPEHEVGWKKLVEPTVLEAQLEGRAMGKVLRVEATGENVMLCAAPLQVPGAGTCGALGLLLRFESKGLAQANLAELRAVTGILDLSCPAAEERRSPRTEARDEGKGLMAVQRAAQFKDLREFAYALTNGLRPKLDCDSVAMGRVVGGRVRVLSISGLDEPKFKNVGTIELQQAMEECHDVRGTIVSQEKAPWADEDISSRHALHRQWRSATRNSAVASIPLMAGEQCVGVVSLRRPSDRPFSKEEIDSVVQLAGTMGPAVELLHRAERTVVRHAKEKLAAGLGELMAPTRFGRKLVTVALLAFVTWFCFGITDHHRVVSCTLQPRETLHLSTPFQARVAEAFVRAGDAVRRGDLLYRFETDQLDLQREELLADIEVRQVEIDQALAEGDLVQASLSKARKNLLETRLRGVERRIDESQVYAPEDGTILRGDLSHRIGQMMPQGEMLFEFAPSMNFYVELEIPESAVSEIEVGQTLRFASNARPDRPLDCMIRHVPFSSEVREGRNVFVGEAVCRDELPNWTRAGMEGVGKVDVGKRGVWEVALKKVVDWFYRVLWL